jgi:hypothetical protein
LGPCRAARNHCHSRRDARSHGGHRQLELLCDHADDELGDEHLGALPRTAEFHDEEPAALGVDDGGKRAAFTERLHVAGGHVPVERWGR